MPEPRSSSLERELLHAVADGALSLTDLRTRLRTNWRSLYAQVERLEAQGTLRTFRVGRRRFVSAKPATALELDRDRAALRGAALRLARAVVAAGRSTPAQLAEASGLSLRTTYARLARLRDLGLVEHDLRAARITAVRPTPRLLRALEG